MGSGTNTPLPKLPDLAVTETQSSLTSAGDGRIAVVFSKEQAAEAEEKKGSALFLCVEVPKSALRRRVRECGRFFDEEA